MKQHQSLSGYIREHLADLEAQASAGIRQDFIIEKLAEKGFIVSLNNFRRLLYRARKRSEAALIAAPPSLPSVKETPPIKKPKTKPTTGFNYTGIQGLDESDLV